MVRHPVAPIERAEDEESLPDQVLEALERAPIEDKLCMRVYEALIAGKAPKNLSDKHLAQTYKDDWYAMSTDPHCTI